MKMFVIVNLKGELVSGVLAAVDHIEAGYGHGKLTTGRMSR